MKYNAGGNSSVRASGFYFTTNPEHFITRHFPSDDDGGSRQLLEKPIDLKTFQKAAVMSDEAMTCLIQLASHKDKKITVHKEADIIIKDPMNALRSLSVAFTCRSVDIGDLKAYTFVKMENRGVFVIKVKPPVVGTFDLRISGKVNSTHRIDIPIVNYTVCCSKVYPNPQPFPLWKPLWGINPCFVEFGFNENTNFVASMVIDTGDVEYKIPTSLPVNAVARLTSLSKSFDDFVQAVTIADSVTVMARFPDPGFYCLEIYCKNGNSAYESVMSSLIECKKGQPSSQKFVHENVDVWI